MYNEQKNNEDTLSPNRWEHFSRGATYQQQNDQYGFQNGEYAYGSYDYDGDDFDDESFDEWLSLDWENTDDFEDDEPSFSEKMALLENGQLEEDDLQEESNLESPTFPSDDESPFYTEDCDNTSPAPESPITIPMKGSKKTIALHKVVKEAAQLLGVKVTEDSRLYQYNPEAGSYHMTKNVVPAIFELLGEERVKLSDLDSRSVANLLLNYPENKITAETFNNKATLINTKTGIVDWLTGEQHEHTKEEFFSYNVDATFLPCVEADLCTPTFDQFCETSLEGDPKKKELLLEILGYCLSDTWGTRTAFLLHGAPSSGKSVILDFLTRLLTKEIISTVALHELDSSFQRASLLGKKVNISGEIAGKKVRDISYFKSLVSGDGISGEFKGKDSFSFVSKAKLIFATNVAIQIKDADTTSAFTDRLTPLIFNCSVAKEDQDKGLLDKLFEERAAIFTKAIYALRRLVERNYAFDLPVDSLEYLHAYTESPSSIVSFVEEVCFFDENEKIHSDVLVQAYYDYCHQKGLEPSSKMDLYTHLSSSHGIRDGRFRLNGENKRGKIGLALKPEFVVPRRKGVDA